MVIDSHIHLTYPNKTNTKKITDLTNDLKRQLSANRIDKAIVIPCFNKTIDKYLGKYLSNQVNNTYSFTTIDITQINLDSELKKQIIENKYYGIKIHPRLQRINLLDHRIINLFNIAVKLDIPIMIDCFPQDDKHFSLDETFPDKIATLAKKIPKAKIIIAHAGGYKLWDAFFIAKSNRNVYLEFSFSLNYFQKTSLIQDFRFVLKKLGGRKCIFGSDYPEISIDKALNIAKIVTTQAGFSQKDKEYFFGETIWTLINKNI